MIPAKSISSPATRAGLLLNELQYSPEPVLDSVLQLLQFAYEQDPGRPGTGREGLILFILRLAVRVESHAKLVLQHAQSSGRISQRGFCQLVRAVQYLLAAVMHSNSNVCSAHTSPPTPPHPASSCSEAREARGSSTGAGARQVAPRPEKLEALEERARRLSGVLRNTILEMMLQWASQAHKATSQKLKDLA